MSPLTVLLSELSRHLLLEMAKQTGLTATELLDKALNAYHRQLFFEQLNADYAELRADPKTWATVEAERQLWDATLMDGLDAGEQWTEDGRCLSSEQKDG